MSVEDQLAKRLLPTERTRTPGLGESKCKVNTEERALFDWLTLTLLLALEVPATKN